MDWDADGTLDLISGSYDPGDLYLFRGLGRGKYAQVETLLDETGTPLVHHPEELKKYERLRSDDGADQDEAIQARVASFGSWPAPVDWDADGDLDLLIGSFAGRVYLRINAGTRAEPVFGAASVELSGIHVTGHADPVAADWDADGLWDLVVGSADGSVSWYRNAGTKAEPSFAEGGTLVEKRADSKFLSQYLMPGAEPGPGARAQICVTDYDGDGDLDLLVGDLSDVYRDPESLDEEQAAELARLEAAARDAGSDDERYRLSTERGALLGQRRHSAVWLYRRVGAGAARAIGAAADDRELEVPVEEPSSGAPVEAGMALSAQTLAVGDVLEVVVRVRVESGWHIYDLDGPATYADTELELDLPEGLSAAGEWMRPPSLPYPSAGSGARIWKGDVRFRCKVRVDAMPEAGSEIGCTLAYQTCNADFCRPPERKELVVPLAVER